MVATPSDIGKNNNREPIIRAACQIIDQTIMNAHKYERTFVFDCDKLKVEYGDLREIVDIYNKAGWYAKYESDQRDGSYITISADKPISFGNYRD